MVIDIWGECHEVDSSFLKRMIIIEEKLIGDTYFVATDGCLFSCHKYFWEPFKREKRINLIIPPREDHDKNL
jgi:hypothetical protein